MQKFIVNGQYQQLLKQHHFDVGKVLKTAHLPENLFTREQIRLTEPEYYALMNAISQQAPDEQTLMNLATYDGIETFSAPIFAAYCSENGLKCIQRLGRYKQLIGPILYQITQANKSVTITFSSLNNLPIDSKFYLASEFLFLIHLLSKATEQRIVPLQITSTFSDFDESFVALVGCTPVISGSNSITFAEETLQLPFITENKTMRDYLMPELNRRLSELDVDDSFSAQVRSALVDLLPAGESAIEDVARKLTISKRTLQRKLKEEQTSFQKQLNSVREMLAKSYLKNTILSSDEIAYLLGYLEVNSFLRAFSVWTGQSISEYRRNNPQ